MSKEEILTVSFCKEDDGETGIVVFKELENDNKYIHNACVLKMEMGEQATNLYYLLTNQAAKIKEIEIEKSEK